MLEVVRVLCGVYHASFCTPDHRVRFQAIVKDILHTHPELEITWMVFPLGGGDFTGWPNPDHLVSLLPVGQITVPTQYSTRYTPETAQELGGTCTWDQPPFIEATFPGMEPHYQIKIATLQFRSPQEKETEP